MIARPEVIIFDVNETLSDTSGLAAGFAAAGLDPNQAAPWFGRVLRDGFALTVTGDNVAFADLARSQLEAIVSTGDLDPAAVDDLVAAFGRLPLHPDVAPGLGRLANDGFRLVTLSNGSTEVAEQLFDAAGVGPRFERLLSVADAPAWKPAGSAYRWALEQCGVGPAAAMLVAAHPWDVHGAAGAGLRTGYLNRTGAPWPRHFRRPDLSAASLPELADRLV